MFTVTEAAGSHLAQLLDQAAAEEEKAIRFVIEADTVTPKLDRVQPDDATFDHEGRTVLVLDPRVVHALTDKTLDVEPMGDGPQLILL
jgi:Fe-S cluster assembly iron-binding protein IscA